ncbi:MULTISPECIES: M23 family metallopeptidase [unclassified Devosia]|uniref:M23 family metallopeptidase n=1 Tax=unclassified Devosia TaxID=196773 RepID=UPI00145EA3F4|nr:MULTISPECIES: M23 family metallopeptidase [unclassified Devosia]MBJ6987004.1 M23 family metallopeptidase [Devosia sp. MC521]QMW64024.1 M23 family metallopeptidase [Devosia sp. MC521]
MSIRVPRRTHKVSVAMAGLMVAAVALSGCSSLGSRTFGDQTVTGSTAQPAPFFANQPMPPSLGAVQGAQNTAFLPPANVGGGGGGMLPPAPAQGGFWQNNAPTSPVMMGATSPVVQTQDLPALNSSPMGNSQAMLAQQNLAPMPAAPAAVAMGNPNASLPLNSNVPVQVSPAANTNGYTHTIASGESLHTIARRYDVTTQSLVHANGMSSPDKIIVGQKIIIPGRSDLNPAPGSEQITKVATISTVPTTPAAAAPQPVLAAAPVAQTAPVAAPIQQAALPQAEPVASGNDKFRWPVSGRIITDFAASRGTGINIDVPEGSAVKAAENGTVIYVGSGVEGYGNLILVRHPNGFVSAYAHLKGMNVDKGATVTRGDTIGTVGSTGSVSKPQLHFELRKGATPVDPVPLLAS